MPRQPIVDAHVHLFDPAAVAYGWMRNVEAFQRPYLLADLDAERAGIEIERIVFVEVNPDPQATRDEVTFVEGLAARDDRIGAIVAQAAIDRGAAVEADLAWLASRPLVRGVRRLIQDEPDPEFCIRPDFVAAVRLLPAHDLSFDICIFHHQLAAALELVRRCPEVRFVLDHIAKPGIRAGLVEPWRSQLRELAAFPNLMCKLSGVATEADHAEWREEQLVPYIDHAIECFGFDRVMFGSDWPVSTFTHRYPSWVEIVERRLGGVGEAELRGLWRDNARAFYRLP